MRVLLVVSEWGTGPFSQGIVRPTKTLVDALCTKGHVVHVLATKRGLISSETRAGSEPNFSLEGLEPRPFDFFPRGKLRFREYVADAIVNWVPDIVISQDWQGLAAGYAKRIDRSPLVTWIHGGTMYDLHGKGRGPRSRSELVMAGLESYQIEHSQLVVSPSALLVKIYRDEYQITVPSNEVIPYHFPNPLRIPTAPASWPLNIVFAGRLSRRKGIEVFLKAAQSAHRQLSGVRVQIFGKSVDYDGQQIARRLKRLGIWSEYCGQLSPEAVWAKICARNSVLVVTSILDNSPNTVYEAIANRVPVLILGSQNGASELRKYSESVVASSQLKSVDWTIFTNRSNSELRGPPELSGLNHSITASWLSALRIARTTAERQQSRPYPTLLTKTPGLRGVSGRSLQNGLRRTWILLLNRAIAVFTSSPN